MIWLLLFAAGLAGMLASLFLAHRKRRRGTERLVADLKADEVTLEKRKDPECRS